MQDIFSWTLWVSCEVTCEDSMNSVTGGLGVAACMPEWASTVLGLVKSYLQGPLGLPPPFLIN